MKIILAMKAALSLLTNDCLAGFPPLGTALNDRMIPPWALRQPNSLSSWAQREDLFAPALPPYLWSKRETVSLSDLDRN
ncbi:hypothetical protein AVEN_199294-1 [Araneus ventricosus]|uniref:Uncharacterized protein n=1 Tax=Araneus ventricosus TaxID=182803 RepID=A0A4Y2T0M0_ARAVE|nr:hypothetical protein AVEN_199294-1 [Araneus ventricosus]